MFDDKNGCQTKIDKLSTGKISLNVQNKDLRFTFLFYKDLRFLLFFIQMSPFRFSVIKQLPLPLSVLQRCIYISLLPPVSKSIVYLQLARI